MSAWNIRRKKPYYELGIRRLKCIRCGDTASEQWQVCADGNNYRPLCLACGDALNGMVLKWMGHPNPRAAIREYRANR